MTGCPTCGNVDIQVLELLTAWNDIEKLKTELKQQETSTAGWVVPTTANIDLSKLNTVVSSVIEPISLDERSWKEKYDAIKAAYVKTRLEVSGSFGNWDFQTRKRVLEHEISSEVGFTI